MVPKKGVLRLDRIIAIVLLFTGFRAYAPPPQQVPDMLITIELKNVLLRDALNRIGDVAHLSFVYVSNKALDKNKVNVTAHRQKVGVLLEKLLRPYSLNFTVVDNRVIVFPDQPGNRVSAAKAPK